MRTLASQWVERFQYFQAASDEQEKIPRVVSVAMLTEGWDANNVTHTLGVRAFGSQLLCEQVVGRGLRRMDYAVDPRSGLLTEEYFDVYGISWSPSGGRPPQSPVRGGRRRRTPCGLPMNGK